MAAAAKAPGVSWHQGVVQHVLDGDTVVLTTGEKIRFLDINTPEIFHDGRPAQPLALAAARQAQQWLLNQPISFSTQGRGRDKFGRTLAHVYVQTPQGLLWVNGQLVRQGLAHVYTFADNARFAKPLLQLEDQARAEKRGLWALPQWQIQRASRCCGAEYINRFTLVQGTPTSVVMGGYQSGAGTYVNFGTNYQTDFTLFIPQKSLKYFKQAGYTSLSCLQELQVRVRGYLTPLQGTQMRITHPAQIELLDNPKVCQKSS